MTETAVFSFHRLFFIFISLLTVLLGREISSLPDRLELLLAIALFFILGIPHGALDISLGRYLLQPIFQGRWLPLFMGFYIALGALIVLFWIYFPLPSFLFFLMISVIHFGFSDAEEENSFLYFLEGIARGLLPISAPAYFYNESFQRLVESSLQPSDALLLTEVASSFFYPTVLILFFLVVLGFFRNKRESIGNSFELLTIFLLFTSLSPFRAFLIYFCFLHSVRHILKVLQEVELPFNLKSLRWVVVEALPSTFFTLVGLFIAYLYLKEATIDLNLMVNLFFISLGALTVPHMLLVEAVRWKSK